MPRSLTAFLLCLGLALPPATVLASSEDELAEQAAEVVEALAGIPESGIPARLLEDAYAIAVIPDVIKVGFLLGGRHGRGLLVVRTPEREWSNPAFISLTGGSFGFQAGIQSTDVILVFKSRASIDNIVNGKVTLGADAAIAAGPVGRRGEAATDTQLRAQIYSYARSKGLFAGVSLEGAALQIDGNANADYYAQPGISADTILQDLSLRRPVSAKKFIETLNRYTPKPS
ncbi:MAG TPA: lipid-binding SYLF domain-containing protein [Nevskiales bacterium]|nr:lipid-binding SYLF domain-containing protein [Nevskiales bacterium]